MSTENLSKSIVDSGYEVAFGISGSGVSFKLINDLVSKGVKYFTVSNESVAAIAAGAYSYHFRSKAIAISIKGPGFANLLAGITACHLENFDLLAISEEYDDSVSTQVKHKRINQHMMLEEVTRERASLLTADLSGFLNDYKAYGPKYFSLSNKEIDPIEVYQKDREMSNDVFDDILSQLNTSLRPLIIIGSELYRLKLEDLLYKISIPVMTTVQAKGSFDEFKPNSFGVYTGVGKNGVPENELIALADLVFSIGLKNEEILGIEAKSSFINVDLNPSESDSFTHTCSISKLKEILEVLRKKQGWGAELKNKYNRIQESIFENNDWLPFQVFRQLDLYTRKCTVFLDTGFFCTVGEHYYRANSKKRFLGSSNGRNMGLSVPMCLGIALKGDPVFCCFGDGGVRYHLGEVRTIAELNLPVCFILFTDGRYGSVVSYLGIKDSDPKLTQPFGTTWSKTFESFGIKSFVAKNEFDFKKVLDDWDSVSPLYIEALFDPELYSKMTLEIRK
jgi:acetolactate synthase-1/2/3 large subunit